MDIPNETVVTGKKGALTTLGKRSTAQGAAAPKIQVEVISKTGDLQRVPVCPATPYWEHNLADQGKILVGPVVGGHPRDLLTPESRLARLKEVGITLEKEIVRGMEVDRVVVIPGSEVDKRRQAAAMESARTRANKKSNRQAMALAQVQIDANALVAQAGGANTAILARLDALEKENKDLKAQASKGGGKTKKVD